MISHLLSKVRTAQEAAKTLNINLGQIEREMVTVTIKTMFYKSHDVAKKP